MSKGIGVLLSDKHTESSDSLRRNKSRRIVAIHIISAWLSVSHCGE